MFQTTVTELADVGVRGMGFDVVADMMFSGDILWMASDLIVLRIRPLAAE